MMFGTSGARLRAVGLLALMVLAVMAVSACGSGNDGDVVTVYVGRSQTLVGPLLEDFSKDTGIKVRVRYGDGTDLVLGIMEEGANSEVDVFYGQDVGALGALKEKGLLSGLSDETLDRVGASFRSPDGLWVGVSGRARVVVYNTDTIKPEELPETFEAYAGPEWKGRLGIVPRSDGFPEFVTAIRVAKGDDFARNFLESLKKNDVHTYPNNLSALQAVANKEIDVAFLNHYYLYRMLAERGDGFKARNHYFDNGDLGGLFLVSGAAVLNSSKNKDAAEKFVQYLLSEKAQRYFSQRDYEYPLVEGVAANPSLPPLDSLAAPEIDLSDLGDLKGSLELMRETGILP